MIFPDFLDNNSSVVIKGMKMPDSCGCCIFNRNNGPYPGVSCMFSTHIWPDKPRTEEEPRLDFCPLSELAFLEPPKENGKSET